MGHTPHQKATSSKRCDIYMVGKPSFFALDFPEVREAFFQRTAEDFNKKIGIFGLFREKRQALRQLYKNGTAAMFHLLIPPEACCEHDGTLTFKSKFRLTKEHIQSAEFSPGLGSSISHKPLP